MIKVSAKNAVEIAQHAKTQKVNVRHALMAFISLRAIFASHAAKIIIARVADSITVIFVARNALLIHTPTMKVTFLLANFAPKTAIPAITIRIVPAANQDILYSMARALNAAKHAYHAPKTQKTAPIATKATSSILILLALNA